MSNRASSSRKRALEVTTDMEATRSANNTVHEVAERPAKKPKIEESNEEKTATLNARDAEMDSMVASSSHSSIPIISAAIVPSIGTTLDPEENLVRTDLLISKPSTPFKLSPGQSVIVELIVKVDAPERVCTNQMQSAWKEAKDFAINKYAHLHALPDSLTFALEFPSPAHRTRFLPYRRFLQKLIGDYLFPAKVILFTWNWPVWRKEVKVDCSEPDMSAIKDAFTSSYLNVRLPWTWYHLPTTTEFCGTIEAMTEAELNQKMTSINSKIPLLSWKDTELIGDVYIEITEGPTYYSSGGSLLRSSQGDIQSIEFRSPASVAVYFNRSNNLGWQQDPVYPLEFRKWQHIPRFAVLTGRNGTGKTRILTRLLGLLSERNPEVCYVNTAWLGAEPDDSSYFMVKGEQYQLPLSDTDADKLCDLARQHKGIPIAFLSDLKESLEKFTELSTSRVVARQIASKFAARSLNHTTAAQLLTVWFNHSAESDSPWESLNKRLEQSRFPFKVVVDTQAKPITWWLMRNDKRFDLASLSTGQYTLFMVCALAELAMNDHQVPIKFLLLDEMDNGMDPKALEYFYRVLGELQRKVQIFCVTHRADAIAILPKEAQVFTVRGPDEGSLGEILSTTKADAYLNLMPSCLRAAHYKAPVYVEGCSDALFFAKLYEILLRFQQYVPLEEKLPLRRLSCRYMMQFIRTDDRTIQKGKESKLGGGHAQVIQRVKNDKSPAMNPAFDWRFEHSYGLIDMDTGEHPKDLPRLKILQRYSLENCLLDPFILLSVNEEFWTSYEDEIMTIRSQLQNDVKDKESLLKELDFYEEQLRSLRGCLGELRARLKDKTDQLNLEKFFGLFLQGMQRYKFAVTNYDRTSQKILIWCSDTFRDVGVDYPKWFAEFEGHLLLQCLFLPGVVHFGPEAVTPNRYQLNLRTSSKRMFWNWALPPQSEAQLQPSWTNQLIHFLNPSDDFFAFAEDIITPLYQLNQAILEGVLPDHKKPRMLP